MNEIQITELENLCNYIDNVIKSLENINGYDQIKRDDIDETINYMYKQRIKVIRDIKKIPDKCGI